MTAGKKRRARQAITAGAAITLLLLGASAAPAYANGGPTYRLCQTSTNVKGLSGYAAASTTVPNTICGQAKARDWYQYAGGGATYWTVWKYGTYTATATAPSGAHGLGGQHAVVSPGAGFEVSFPFGT